MTNTWADTNFAVTMDGNPAEAHPCGFKWVTEAKAHNKARLIVVDPRFTRSAAIADLYRASGDIAWLGGPINYLLANDKIPYEYLKVCTKLWFFGWPVHQLQRAKTRL
jgi:formate dehydrogenase major subunit